MSTTDDRFLYQAHAVGFSGRIRRPFEEIIEAQASSALPSSGGFVRSSVGKFNHKGIIKFDAAYTVITGSEDEEGFDTLISATVENLNILDQVTAVRVVAHMTSHHPRGEDQPFIIPIDCRAGQRPRSIDTIIAVVAATGKQNSPVLAYRTTARR